MVGEEQNAQRLGRNERGTALPAGFICPRCDYDLGGAAMGVCPECGRPIVVHDVVQFRRREDARRVLRRAVRMVAWRALVAVVVMSGGAMMLALDLGAAVGAFIACSVAVVGSIGSGWIAAMLAPERDRAAVRLAWLIAVPWLNGPWLVAPIFAACGTALVVAGAVTTRVEPDDVMVGGVAFAIGMLGGLLWLIVAGSSVVLGALRFWQVVREYGVRKRGWWPGFVLALFVVGGGAMLLGLSGLIFAAGAAEDLATHLAY